MNALTARQREVLDHIVTFAVEFGHPPTRRELGDGLGIASTNGVNDHLMALKRKGYIDTDRLISRGIIVTEKARREILGPPCERCGGSGRRP